ncbi:hypothetical protein ruthe_01398 [Rubellimicrobium thermophilum DSM 16684]|uniref:Thrombospondin type 3 repeat protein n=1 Tax=Rubellimicrobium thermophilum DSM 16684 TaxID=1123069 RepID=S9QZ14_9RHOB|nr:hypothetical protein [Rubellimicrobium thermophilum]EPX86581.1 hypothetical protein ruthe_01398 [Rubellimicrobium thermophilum DSM 16684]
MQRPLILLALLAALAACGDGQPFFDGDGGDAGSSTDSDGDGITDDLDPDDDNDGIPDSEEPDSDGDGLIDDRDTDDDNDGIPDTAEMDTDGDGLIDDRDTDDDNDGIPDTAEMDTDGDGLIDDKDPDDDNDGIRDEDDGAPPGSGFTDTGGVGAIPSAIAGNLTRVAYNPADDTLSVTLDSLDTTPISAVYRRTPALDLPGYTAYSVQEDPLDRMFVALVATSPDGTSMGGVVADGGQFNRVFGGAFYRRIGAYSPPCAEPAGQWPCQLCRHVCRSHEHQCTPPGGNPSRSRRDR